MTEPTYAEELKARVTHLVESRAATQETMISLLRIPAKKETERQIPRFKEVLESQLSQELDLKIFSWMFHMEDSIFDPLDDKEKNQDLRLEACKAEALSAIKHLGWDSYESSCSQISPSWFKRLTGERTIYMVQVWVPLFDTLSKSERAADEFIRRIQTGVLKPLPDPTSIHEHAAKEGITVQQLVSDIERVHTGQVPKYIKIERPHEQRQ